MQIKKVIIVLAHNTKRSTLICTQSIIFYQLPEILKCHYSSLIYFDGNRTVSWKFINLSIFKFKEYLILNCFRSKLGNVFFYNYTVIYQNLHSFMFLSFMRKKMH